MPWIAPSEWKALVSGKSCPMCADAHEVENGSSLLVAELSHSFMRFSRNQYAKGWVVVIAKRHVCELHEMAPEELAGYWRNVAQASRALSDVYRPIKVNYMVFGNLVPHVHCHLLPRFPDHDPSPQLFLDLSTHASELSPEDCRRSIDDLREALSRAPSHA